jgi:hypothetical protein
MSDLGVCTTGTQVLLLRQRFFIEARRSMDVFSFPFCQDTSFCPVRINLESAAMVTWRRFDVSEDEVATPTNSKSKKSFLWSFRKPHILNLFPYIIKSIHRTIII